MKSNRLPYWHHSMFIYLWCHDHTSYLIRNMSFYIGWNRTSGFLFGFLLQNDLSVVCIIALITENVPQQKYLLVFFLAHSVILFAAFKNYSVIFVIQYLWDVKSIDLEEAGFQSNALLAQKQQIWGDIRFTSVWGTVDICIYRQTSNIRRTKSWNLNASHFVLQLSLPNPLNHVLREWRCNWSSADRRCSNYIWVINNFIVY